MIFSPRALQLRYMSVVGLRVRDSAHATSVDEGGHPFPLPGSQPTLYTTQKNGFKSAMRGISTYWGDGTTQTPLSSIFLSFFNSVILS